MRRLESQRETAEAAEFAVEGRIWVADLQEGDDEWRPPHDNPQHEHPHQHTTPTTPIVRRKGGL